jgi:periplasmic protein CpxP/Spy
MKKMVFFLAVAFGAVFTVNAQGGGGGFQRRTVEERVKSVMDKLVDFKLDKDKTTQTDSAFSAYYRAQDKMREEMMAAGGPPDRDAMREKMQKNAGERDEKLKKIFTADQFKKWKDEIEPTTRPQRPGGGGGNGGGNNG